jgi:hypothetical protein
VRLTGSRVGELPPQLFTDYVHFAPQNAPQIASCAVFSRRLTLSLVLVKVVCRRVASSGEKRINTFTRLKSQVRVLQRPRVLVFLPHGGDVIVAGWAVSSATDFSQYVFAGDGSLTPL